MKRTLWSLGMVAAWAVVGVAADKADEVAKQWDAFADKSVEAEKSGLAEKIDVDFNGMGGRVLMFMEPPSGLWGLFYPKGVYENLDLAAKCLEIKRLGVTDIIFNGGFTGSYGTMYGRSGNLPSRCYPHKANQKDDLADTAKACRAVGLGLWLSMHGLQEGRCNNPKILGDHQSLYAKDSRGKCYAGPGARAGAGGGPYDLLSEEVFKFLSDQIDNIIDVTRPYGCFQGFFWDEFWFNYQTNYFGAHYDRFGKFCRDNYGETPPEAVREKIDSLGKWQDIEDKWWRRYVLWKETLIDQFEAKLIDYINRKGYKVIDQRVRRGSYPRDYAWRFGKSVRSMTLGDWQVEGAKQNIYLDNAITICWIFGAQGLNNARMVTGRPTCAFTYWYIEAALPGNRELMVKKMGENYVKTYTDTKTVTRATDEARVLFRNVRRWDGAKSLADTAVVMSDRGNIFHAKNPGDLHTANEKALVDALSYLRPVRLIDAEFPECFSRFKTLVVSGPALENLSGGAYAALKTFVENGGLLVAIEPKVMVASPDGTNAVDKTAELFGIAYGARHYPLELAFTPTSPIHKNLRLKTLGQSCLEAKALDASVTALAYLDSDAKTAKVAVTVKRLGKGAALGIYFNLNNLIQLENEKPDSKVFTQLFDGLIGAFENAAPPLELAGAVRVEECLKKGDDIAATFYSDYPLPAFGAVKINSALLDKTAEYAVTRRSRGVADRVKSPSGRTVWTPTELTREGFCVEVAPDRGYELIEIEKQTAR